METLKPNQQRAKIAITFMWICIGLLIVEIIASWFQLNLCYTINRGDNYSNETIRFNDLFHQVFAIFAFILYIIIAVVFIQWFRRAYYNLHVKMDNLSHSEGWAAGYWFIPVANLYYPYRIMKELYTATDTLLSNHNEHYQEKYPRALLITWWLLWVTGSIMSNQSARLSWSAETIDEIITYTQLDIISAILLIPAALLVMKIVRDYNEMEIQVSQIDEDESGDFSRHLASEAQV